MASRIVSVPIQFITERQANETANEAKNRIQLLIRNEVSPISLSLDVTSTGSPKLNDDEYESSQVVRLQGEIRLQGSAPSACRSFIQKFVSMGQQSLYLSVNPVCPEQDVVFDPLCLRESIKDDNRITRIEDFHLGSRVGYTDFVSHFHAHKANKSFRMENLTAAFDHDMGKLHVNFFNRNMYSRVQNVGTNYEIRVKYESVAATVLVPIHAEKDLLRAYFILKYSPSLYEMVISEMDIWEQRAPPFARCATFPIRIADGGILKQDFGRCNVLVIDLPAGQSTKIDPWLLMSNFKRFTDYTSPIPFYFAFMDVHDGHKFKERSLEDLRQEQFFSILYAIKSCISISHQFVDDLCLNHKWDQFVGFVLAKSKAKMPVMEKAIFDLFKILERNATISVLPTLIDIYSDLVVSNYTDYTRVRGVRKIRRAVLTLTHVILLPPHPFVESRLLRLCEPDFALRCHIRDDDDNMLTYTLGNGTIERQREFLMRHIRDPVISGIRIGQRVYHFLGSSASQIRDHGFILYAEDGLGNDATYYRRAIGDFSRILCVGKFIARVGQAFSQMLESVVIDSVIPEQIKDIMHGIHPISNNPYNFTDGVGKVSPKLAKTFAAKLGLDNVPSAFQIRYKGCKGLVVVDNTIDQEVEFLGYRKSMDKFPCDIDTLEILKYSCPRAVYLNRPLIALLDQLDTPLSTFERLLADHVSKLINAFLDEDSAIECIRSYCPQIFKLMRMELFHNSGLSILSEPFFRKVLDVIIKKKIRELKQSARIQIPYDEGRNMFGVADEYQCMEYGEVFVQYTHSSGDRRVLTGLVMVTKNPCMHPGDVRKFMAVDKPQLHHIVDCIVFPTKGPRPHPNEMAGSDLDGDEYSVFWMKDLFFRKPNQEAMVFSDEPAEELNRPVDVSDIMEFFCEFIRTNTVGLIANAHLAIADTQSIFHPKCLQLCAMYSEALDFAKTGRNVELPPEDRPKHYPDFMEKGAERSTYKSDKVLGVLFRWVDLFEKALCDSSSDADPNHVPNPLLKCDGWEEFEEIAMDDFEKYKMTCECLLKELGIESEEYLLTCISQRTGKFASGKKEDMQEMLERIVKDTFQGFRERFLEGTNNELERTQKAVAYYIAARSNQSGKKWHGLPWIAAPELAALMLGQNVEKNLQEVTIATLIDSILPDDDFDPFSRAARFLSNWVERDPLRRDRVPSETAEEKRHIDDTLQLLRNQMPGTGDPVHGHGPAAGEIIVKMFKRLITDMMNSLHQAQRGPSRLRSIKLGITAMISLNKCFRTGKIDSLTATGDPVPHADELRMKHFHISLSLKGADRLTQLVEHHHAIVLTYLTDHSSVSFISARMASQHNYRYWLVTAVGDEWSLAKLSSMLIQQNFYSHTSGEIDAILRPNNARNNNDRRNRNH